MVLAESFGIGEHKIVVGEYFPSLAILDTEEILERIGLEWVNPGPDKRHGTHDIDEILSKWIYFLDRANIGHTRVRDFEKSGIVSGDVPSITSYSILYRALGGGERYPEIITSLRSAFEQLLSDEARTQLERSSPSVVVDDELRQKINGMMKSIFRQACAHFAHMDRQLSEFNDD